MRVLKHRKTAKKRTQTRHKVNSERVKMNVTKGDTVRVMRGDEVEGAENPLQRSNSASHFAAQMKSFPDRPPIAWVEYSTRHWL